MHEVCIDWADGSCEESQQETWPDVQDVLDEFRDQPVRIYVDGNIVQKGFITTDDIPLPWGL